MAIDCGLVADCLRFGFVGLVLVVNCVRGLWFDSFCFCLVVVVCVWWIVFRI